MVCSIGNRINEGDLRFVNETHQFTLLGRLEIYIGGQWGTICSAGFGAEDAKLACSQLGFRTYFRYGSVEELG